MMPKHTSVSKKATIGDEARLSGHAVIRGRASVLDRSRVSGHGEVSDRAVVKDNARIAGHAEVIDQATVSGDAWVYGDALVKATAQVTGHACVFADAVIDGDTVVGGHANVGPGARVKHTGHVVTYSASPIDPRQVADDPRTKDGPQVWTAYRTRKDGVGVLLARTPKKISEAPAELLEAVTWTQIQP